MDVDVTGAQLNILTLRERLQLTELASSFGDSPYDPILFWKKVAPFLRGTINLESVILIRSSLNRLFEMASLIIVNISRALQSIEFQCLGTHPDMDCLYAIKQYGTHLDQHPEKVALALPSDSEFNMFNIPALSPVYQPPYAPHDNPSGVTMNKKMAS